MDELLEILQDMHPEVDFDACDTLVDDKVLDSFDIVTIVSEIYEPFDIVTLISEIYDTFGVAVPAEEIVPANFNSATALYALIQRLEDE